MHQLLKSITTPNNIDIMLYSTCHSNLYKYGVLVKKNRDTMFYTDHLDIFKAKEFFKMISEKIELDGYDNVMNQMESGTITWTQ